MSDDREAARLYKLAADQGIAWAPDALTRRGWQQQQEEQERHREAAARERQRRQEEAAAQERQRQQQENKIDGGKLLSESAKGGRRSRIARTMWRPAT
jgi:hypothetical protein